MRYNVTYWLRIIRASVLTFVLAGRKKERKVSSTYWWRKTFALTTYAVASMRTEPWVGKFRTQWLALCTTTVCLALGEEPCASWGVKRGSGMCLYSICGNAFAMSCGHSRRGMLLCGDSKHAPIQVAALSHPPLRNV